MEAGLNAVACCGVMSVVDEERREEDRTAGREYQTLFHVVATKECSRVVTR